MKYKKKCLAAHSRAQLERCAHTWQLSTAASTQSFSLSASSHCWVALLWERLHFREMFPTLNERRPMGWELRHGWILWRIVTIFAHDLILRLRCKTCFTKAAVTVSVTVFRFERVKDHINTWVCVRARQLTEYNEWSAECVSLQGFSNGGTTGK